LSSKPLKIFVAMPGTDMGLAARWQNPDRIKARFFEAIGERLERRLQCKIDLVVEKDREKSGVIYKSMFNEALEADVYIADITGNNPNVYLELGVRWGLKDKVTIIVRQEEGSVKFNVAANRIFRYSDDPDVLEHALESVVKAIETGLTSQEIDSPVRQHIEGVPRYSERDVHELKERNLQLEAENKFLRSQQGRDYLAAGRTLDDPEDRLRMFRQAVGANPNFVEAYFELGLELRKLSRYNEAVEAFRRAVLLEPGSALFHRELGLAYSKMESLEFAISSLREAVKLNAKDAEAWSILGGALRRLGMEKLLRSHDWNTLSDAKNSYTTAFELDEHDAYALGNVARLDLLFSKNEPALKSNAVKEFEMLRHLTAFNLIKQPKDYWLRFDLADTYLLSGEAEKGYQLYQEAIGYVPEDYYASVFSSVSSPLEEFLSLDAVDDPISTTIQKILEDFKRILAKS